MRYESDKYHQSISITLSYGFSDAQFVRTRFRFRSLSDQLFAAKQLSRWLQLISMRANNLTDERREIMSFFILKFRFIKLDQTETKTEINPIGDVICDITPVCSEAAKIRKTNNKM